jgi:hypothetical protein
MKNSNRFLNLNLNDLIQVRLTNRGHEILKYNSLSNNKIYEPRKKDKDGWTTFQLWEIMFLFGEEMYLGNENMPIQPEMRIYEDEQMFLF